MQRVLAPFVVRSFDTTQDNPTECEARELESTKDHDSDARPVYTYGTRYILLVVHLFGLHARGLLPRLPLQLYRRRRVGGQRTAPCRFRFVVAISRQPVVEPGDLVVFIRSGGATCAGRMHAGVQ